MRAPAVLIALLVVAVAGCADDGVGTGYLSYGDDILLCDDQPDPDTGRCTDVTYGAQSFTVLNHQEVATTSAGDRTISLEPIRLTLEDDVVYEAHTLDE